MMRDLIDREAELDDEDDLVLAEDGDDTSRVKRRPMKDVKKRGIDDSSEEEEEDDDEEMAKVLRINPGRFDTVILTPSIGARKLHCG